MSFYNDNSGVKEDQLLDLQMDGNLFEFMKHPTVTESDNNNEKTSPFDNTPFAHSKTQNIDILGLDDNETIDINAVSNVLSRPFGLEFASQRQVSNPFLMSEDVFAQSLINDDSHVENPIDEHRESNLLDGNHVINVEELNTRNRESENSISDENKQSDLGSRDHNIAQNDLSDVMQGNCSPELSLPNSLLEMHLGDREEGLKEKGTNLFSENQQNNHLSSPQMSFSEPIIMEKSFEDSKYDLRLGMDHLSPMEAFLLQAESSSEMAQVSSPPLDFSFTISSKQGEEEEEQDVLLYGVEKKDLRDNRDEQQENEESGGKMEQENGEYESEDSSSEPTSLVEKEDISAIVSLEWLKSTTEDEATLEKGKAEEGKDESEAPERTQEEESREWLKTREDAGVVLHQIDPQALYPAIRNLICPDEEKLQDKTEERRVDMEEKKEEGRSEKLGEKRSEERRDGSVAGDGCDRRRMTVSVSNDDSGNPVCSFEPYSFFDTLSHFQLREQRALSQEGASEKKERRDRSETVLRELANSSWDVTKYTQREIVQLLEHFANQIRDLDQEKSALESECIKLRHQRRGRGEDRRELGDETASRDRRDEVTSQGKRKYGYGEVERSDTASLLKFDAWGESEKPAGVASLLEQLLLYWGNVTGGVAVGSVVEKVRSDLRAICELYEREREREEGRNHQEHYFLEREIESLSAELHQKKGELEALGRERRDEQGREVRRGDAAKREKDRIKELQKDSDEEEHFSPNDIQMLQESLNLMRRETETLMEREILYKSSSIQKDSLLEMYHKFLKEVASIVLHPSDAPFEGDPSENQTSVSHTMTQILENVSRNFTSQNQRQVLTQQENLIQTIESLTKDNANLLLEKEQLEQALQKLNDIVANNNVEIEKLESECQALSVDLSIQSQEVEKEREKIRVVVEEMENLREEREKSLINNIQAEGKEDIAQGNQNEEQINKLNQEYNKSKDEEGALQKEIMRLRYALQNASSELAQACETMEHQKIELKASLNTEFAVQRSSMEEIAQRQEEEIMDLKHQLNNNTLGYEDDLGDLYRQLGLLKAENEQLLTSNSENERKTGEMEESVLSLRAQLNTMEEVNQSLRLCINTREVDKTNSKSAALGEEIESLNSQIKELQGAREAEISTIRNELLSSARERETLLEDRIAELQEALKKNAVVYETECEVLRNDLSSLQISYQDAIKKCMSEESVIMKLRDELESRIALRDMEINDLQKELADLRNAKEGAQQSDTEELLDEEKKGIERSKESEIKNMYYDEDLRLIYAEQLQKYDMLMTQYSTLQEKNKELQDANEALITQRNEETNTTVQRNGWERMEKEELEKREDQERDGESSRREKGKAYRYEDGRVSVRDITFGRISRVGDEEEKESMEDIDMDAQVRNEVKRERERERNKDVLSLQEILVQLDNSLLALLSENSTEENMMNILLHIEGILTPLKEKYTKTIENLSSEAATAGASVSTLVASLPSNKDQSLLVNLLQRQQILLDEKQSLQEALRTYTDTIALHQKKISVLENKLSTSSLSLGNGGGIFFSSAMPGNERKILELQKIINEMTTTLLDKDESISSLRATNQYLNEKLSRTELFFEKLTGQGTVQ